MNSTLRDRLFSVLNLHIAAVVLLAALDITLGVRLALFRSAANPDSEDRIALRQIAATQLQHQVSKLDGLPEKVDTSRKGADVFFEQRVPATDSAMVEELGQLASHNNVHLTRASYTQAPAIPGLAEIRIDASISGEYTGIMHFINGLERDKTFFLISGLTLTGQQGGLVNLRVRLSAYLRSADAANIPQAEGQPSAGPAAPGPAAPAPAALHPASGGVR